MLSRPINNTSFLLVERLNWARNVPFGGKSASSANCIPLGMMATLGCLNPKYCLRSLSSSWLLIWMRLALFRKRFWNKTEKIFFFQKPWLSAHLSSKPWIVMALGVLFLNRKGATLPKCQIPWQCTTSYSWMCALRKSHSSNENSGKKRLMGCVRLQTMTGRLRGRGKFCRLVRPTQNIYLVALLQNDGGMVINNAGGPPIAQV